jgi:hypothetical protein
MYHRTDHRKTLKTNNATTRAAGLKNCTEPAKGNATTDSEFY